MEACANLCSSPCINSTEIIPWLSNMVTELCGPELVNSQKQMVKTNYFSYDSLSINSMEKQITELQQIVQQRDYIIQSLIAENVRLTHQVHDLNRQLRNCQLIIDCQSKIPYKIYTTLSDDPHKEYRTYSQLLQWLRHTYRTKRCISDINGVRCTRGVNCPYYHTKSNQVEDTEKVG